MARARSRSPGTRGLSPSLINRSIRAQALDERLDRAKPREGSGAAPMGPQTNLFRPSAKRELRPAACMQKVVGSSPIIRSLGSASPEQAERPRLASCDVRGERNHKEDEPTVEAVHPGVARVAKIADGKYLDRPDERQGE